MKEFKTFSDEDSNDSSVAHQIVEYMAVADSSESSLDSSSTAEEDMGDSEWKLSEDDADHSGVSATATAGSEDDEDVVVKAINAAKQKKATHPPDINFKNFVMDLSLHPASELLAVSSITGDIYIYNYSLESCDLVETLELHSKSCTNVEYSQNGKYLVSCGKEKSIMISDVATNKLLQFYDDAHEVPPYSLFILDDNRFCTGDEGGVLKVWDIRNKIPICSYKTGNEQITSMISNDDGRFIVCSACDVLSTYDFNARKFFVQSEVYETELTSLNLVKRGTKLVVGTFSGAMYIFNWGQFGYHSDVFPGLKRTINTGLAITDHILLTGRDDGQIMATNLFPHKELGVAGQHSMSVEAMDITHDGNFVASVGLDETVKFWESRSFEDIQVKTEKAKKTDAKNNLPSSQLANPADFFADLS